MVRENLSRKEAFELRPESSEEFHYCKICGDSNIGRRSSMCKGPEVVNEPGEFMKQINGAWETKRNSQPNIREKDRQK